MKGKENWLVVELVPFARQRDDRLRSGTIWEVVMASPALSSYVLVLEVFPVLSFISFPFSFVVWGKGKDSTSETRLYSATRPSKKTDRGWAWYPPRHFSNFFLSAQEKGKERKGKERRKEKEKKRFWTEVAGWAKKVIRADAPVSFLDVNTSTPVQAGCICTGAKVNLTLFPNISNGTETLIVVNLVNTSASILAGIFLAIVDIDVASGSDETGGAFAGHLGFIQHAGRPV